MRNQTAECIFIRLGTHVTHSQKMNSTNFQYQCQWSNVKVTLNMEISLPILWISKNGLALFDQNLDNGDLMNPTYLEVKGQGQMWLFVLPFVIFTIRHSPHTLVSTCYTPRNEVRGGGILESPCPSVRLETRARLGKIARLGIGCRGGYFVPLGQPHSSSCCLYLRRQCWFRYFSNRLYYR